MLEYKFKVTCTTMIKYTEAEGLIHEWEARRLNVIFIRIVGAKTLWEAIDGVIAEVRKHGYAITNIEQL